MGSCSETVLSHGWEGRARLVGKRYKATPTAAGRGCPDSHQVPGREAWAGGWRACRWSDQDPIRAAGHPDPPTWSLPEPQRDTTLLIPGNRDILTFSSLLELEGTSDPNVWGHRSIIHVNAQNASGEQRAGLLRTASVAMLGLIVGALGLIAVLDFINVVTKTLLHLFILSVLGGPRNHFFAKTILFHYASQYSLQDTLQKRSTEIHCTVKWKGSSVQVLGSTLSFPTISLSSCLAGV